jgi:A/G-specific adenine glycosylase
MELGATVCLPREPRCETCPVHRLCEARRLGIENELPIAKKKKPPLEVEMVALVSRRRARILLGRRRPAGLFGGLWEPPMVEVSDLRAAETILGTLVGVKPLAMERVGRQTHVLTHRRLQITIVTAEIEGEPEVANGAPYDCLAWKPVSELGSLAMSSLAKKVLLACPA